MYNVVIFSNSLNFIKKYTNLLSSNFNDIRIAGITSNKSDLSNVYSQQHIDLIIVNSKNLYRKYFKSYVENTSTIMLISPLFNSISKEKNIFYINEYLNSSLILKIFQKILYSTSESYMKKYFHNLMKNLSFNFKLKGSNYLLEAITYAYMNKTEYLYDNLEKNIYSLLSKKYNVNNSVIKHSIIRAINNANSNTLKAYFNNLDKITSKSLITEFVNSI